jgi:hypothetical protein
MRRSLQFCDWRAEWWESLQSSRQCTNVSTKVAFPTALCEALRAYALEHVLTERRRANRWKGNWEALRKRAAEVLEAKLGKVERAMQLDELSVTLPDITEDLPEYIVADDEDDE